MTTDEMIEETTEDITAVVIGETTGVMEDDQEIGLGSVRAIVIGVTNRTEGGVVIEIGMIEEDLLTIIRKDERHLVRSHCKTKVPLKYSNICPFIQ